MLALNICLCVLQNEWPIVFHLFIVCLFDRVENVSFKEDQGQQFEEEQDFFC